MLRRGKEEDKKVIFDIYAKSGMLNLYDQDDYFSDSFCAENVIVNEINGHVAASLQVNYHTMMFNERKIISGVVFGQFFERNKGVKALETLRNEVFDQQRYKTLFTLIPTDNEQEYSKYGFDAIYQKRIYQITSKDLSNISYNNVSKQFESDALLKVYKDFTKRFNGYLLRDKQYYLDLIDWLQSKRYNLAVYYSDENVCEGYMIYSIESNKVAVREIIYLNGSALTQLLSYGLKIKSKLDVYVSQSEDLSRAYPKVSYKQVAAMAVRINDIELFNKLFGVNVTDTVTGYKLNERPLFISDLRYR